ncbi:hypothetical protein [Actinoplanes couchii]|uniref:Uncharacterized protein n=1 Tax=Actinoplanes couchii TaxID=403638 RepID=A0ABQ3XA37_9ACTN|nr:hypothetical protein [Actinoplanes couchii]MDR6325068.1 hypothetical protein [Actinoplanes couchii]GID55308.1 hypothetical protein Aco03nite_037120 [Actinoplanes couchii]
MRTRVIETPRAAQQVGGLRKKDRAAYEKFLDMLEAQGCAALGYRLTGDLPIDHLCVKHLIGSLRVVVGFEAPGVAWVLLVGLHARADPGVDVYTELYRLAGLADIPTGERRKPTCCTPDGTAPTATAEITNLANRAHQLRTRSR